MTSDLTTKAAEIRAGLVADWRKAMEGVTPGEWAPGCIVRAESGCQCRYIFGGDYMGAIAEVYVDNGIRGLENGQNDCPPVDEARANTAWIARCSPAGIASLLDLIEQQAAELAREQTESARRLACMDRRADRLIELTDALAKVKTEYDGLLSTWAESRERHLAAEARATTAESERDELLREKERLGGVLRGLASYLSVGGYNTDTVDADVFDRKIRDGIEILTAPLREGWQRYLKLRSIGVAPNGTLHLQKGLVLVATNLDKWVDEYLAKGRPPAPSHAVEFDASQALENGPAGLADANSKSPSPSSQSSDEKEAVR